MVYVVLDLEFNQPYDFLNNKSGRVIGNCRFEIIQIGAVKLSEDLEVIGKFDEMIRPTIYKRIHPHVEKITGITAASLKDKRRFTEVYRDFRAFLGDDPETIFGIWGGADIEALYRNMLYYKLCGEDVIFKYTDIQKLAARKLKYSRGTAIGLKTAVDMFKIEIDSPFHDAFCDADYTARILKLVKDDGINIRIFNTSQLVEKKRKAMRSFIS